MACSLAEGAAAELAELAEQAGLVETVSTSTAWTK
jgi:hypothetical protein